MTTKATEFKRELKTLLEKYNVSIGFECADCSDLYGVYDEMIVIQDNKTNENIVEVDGYWICPNDLK